MDELKKGNDNSFNILVLNKDVEFLKSARQTLIQHSYGVKCVRTMFKAYTYMRLHRADLLLIGKDSIGLSARDSYDYLRDSLRENGVQAIVMEENLFATELLEKINRALE